jgi:glycine cleavage system H protein
MTAEFEYRDDRRFHRGHTWALSLDSRRVRVGLDSFAVRLMGRAISIVFPTQGSLLARNEAGCWLVDEAGPIPIRMPLSGRVLRVNKRLLERPALAAEDPYGEGWLLEIDGGTSAAEVDDLMDAPTAAAGAENDWNRFRGSVDKHQRKGKMAVGPTMADGGVRLDDLRSMLGAPRYRRLLMEFL